MAFHPDGRRLASANGNKTVSIWDSTTWEALQVLRGHSSGVNSVQFSPDGGRLASASYDQTVRLWDTATGAQLHSLRGHTNVCVSSVAFAPDGQRLASGGADKTVRVWDALPARKPSRSRRNGIIRWFAAPMAASSPRRAGMRSGRDCLGRMPTCKPLFRLTGHADVTSSVAFRPDSRQLASAARDNTVLVWDTATWKEPATLQGHSRQINQLAYSPDGKCLASSSDDKTVIIWDPATRQVVRTLRGHTAPVTGVAFSPDGHRLASSSDDKTIRIWNAATGQVIDILSGHLKEVTSVAFDPTGNSWPPAARMRRSKYGTWPRVRQPLLSRATPAASGMSCSAPTGGASPRQATIIPSRSGTPRVATKPSPSADSSIVSTVSRSVRTGRVCSAAPMA